MKLSNSGLLVFVISFMALSTSGCLLKKDGESSGGGGGGGGGSESTSAAVSCGSPVAEISQTVGSSQTVPTQLHPMVQSFTVATTKRISRISVTLMKSPSGSANIQYYVAIYSGGALLPDFSNPALTTVTASVSLSPLSAASYNFDFPTQPTLSPGVTYWIYGLPSGPAYQLYSNTNVYPNGIGLYWDGGTPNAWSNNPGAGSPLIGDLLFKVWTCD